MKTDDISGKQKKKKKTAQATKQQLDEQSTETLNTKTKKPKKKLEKKPDELPEEAGDESGEFNIDDVLHFGGEQSDFDLLRDVDNDDEEFVDMDDEERGKSDDAEAGSLRDLLQNILDTEKSATKKDKKKKADCAAPPIIESEKKKKNDVEESAEETEQVEDPNPKKQTRYEPITLNNYSMMLMRNVSPWFQLTDGLPRGESGWTDLQIEQLHSVAKQLWKKEEELYQKGKENERSSDAQWLRTVLTSGTLSDKVAAFTMLVQESPLHQMRSMTALMNMTKKKSRREALIAIDSLRHLWVSDVLPDRKLRAFNENRLDELQEITSSGGKQAQDKLLISLACEHEIRAIYEQYVDRVEELSRDALKNIRAKVLGIVFELLAMKPERERKLLSIIVNKLGDPDRKIAAKSTYLLTQLVTRHPNMKAIIIGEVERVLYRPNISERAQYYAICFLNQLVLSHEESEVASRLISIYFTFFKAFTVKKKGESEKKLLSALLIGVNRAFPFTKPGDDQQYDEQMNMLFKLTHSSHINTSLQALMLLYQVMESRQSVSDRFYQALYEKLLHPEINVASRQTMFLNLLYKSIKADPSLKRVKAFMRRLIQVSAHEQPSLTCGVFFLLAEILKIKPGAKCMTLQAQEDDEEEHFTDAKLEGDDDKLEGEDDKKENEVDEAGSEESITETKVPASRAGASSWTFVNTDTDPKRSISYEMAHRNPLYCAADIGCAWEATVLANHFHPSVAHFARDVIKGEAIDYKGDPLQDFTLMRFLDRFIYRNPKKLEKDHGTSVMQPRKQSARLREEPVNSKQFLRRPAGKIRDDEMFFYRYFQQKEGSHRDDTQEDEEGDVSEPEQEDIEDMDFARSMDEGKKLKSQQKKKKKKEGVDDEDDDDDGDDEMGDDDNDDGGDDIEQGGDESDDEFDYKDLADESDEDADTLVGEKEEFSDKDYEKALFANLDSDGESMEEDDDDDDDGPSTGTGEATTSSMFADAEEFAHMMNDKPAVHPKQRAWETRQENRDWREKKKSFAFKNKSPHSGSANKNKSPHGGSANKNKSPHGGSANNSQKRKHNFAPNNSKSKRKK